MEGTYLERVLNCIVKNTKTFLLVHTKKVVATFFIVKADFLWVRHKLSFLFLIFSNWFLLCLHLALCWNKINVMFRFDLLNCWDYLGKNDES